jgi:hypothetical protein
MTHVDTLTLGVQGVALKCLKGQHDCRVAYKSVSFYTTSSRAPHIVLIAA